VKKKKGALCQSGKGGKTYLGKIIDQRKAVLLVKRACCSPVWRRTLSGKGDTEKRGGGLS